MQEATPSPLKQEGGIEGYGQEEEGDSEFSSEEKGCALTPALHLQDY